MPSRAATEAPIVALSLVVLEGRFATEAKGPVTLAALKAMLAHLATIPDAVIASAADVNAVGPLCLATYRTGCHGGLRFTGCGRRKAAMSTTS